MDQEDVNQKIQSLDAELKSLKEAVSSPDQTKTLGAALRRLNRFISTYQPLLTVLTAIVTLVFLQMNFGFGTWAGYRAASKAKDANAKVATFYRQLGDHLVYEAQYDDAAVAYKSALALQPNDAQAIYGLTKAQTFNLPAGQKYNDIQLVLTKINYLTSFNNDADVEFLKCQTFLSFEETQVEAEASCKRALELNPRLYVAHVDLGYLCVKRGDFECAKDHYRQALEINPDRAETNGSLGTCELLELKPEAAKPLLEKAVKLSQNVSHMLDLGEGYRYLKDLDKAIKIHTGAKAIIEEQDIEKEPIARNDWFINAMPMRQDDTKTKVAYFIVHDITIKRAVVAYALAVDYALQEDFVAAQTEIESAKKNDPANGFGDYFVNRACSAANILTVDAKIRLWLKEKSKQTCSKKVCGVIDTLFR